MTPIFSRLLRVRRMLLLLGALIAIAGSTWGQAQPSCNFNGGYLPIRAEGYTERVVDVQFSCYGGTPTPAGQAVPQIDITVVLNAKVTSKITAPTSLFTEALLLIDEPNTDFNFGGPQPGTQRPLLNCGQTGAPDSGPSGSGVCSITATGDPKATYDGSKYTFGTAYCDGSDGVPDSYGCGRPNAFQGQVTPSGTSITFRNVPFDNPGNFLRSFLITNIRVDATKLPLCVASFGCDSPVLASVTLGALAPSPLFVVALAKPGLASRILNKGDLQHPATIRLTKIGSSFSPKNFSFVVGDNLGTPANGYNDRFFHYHYDGGVNYPADVAQNYPGLFYYTESGYMWPNDTANGPPAPLPNLPQIQDLGFPLGSYGYGPLNTEIEKAGTADTGTRIALRFANLQGHSVRVPRVVYLRSPSNPAVNTGVLVLTKTGAAGAGAFSRIEGPEMVDPGGLAVYEVLYSDPISFEYADVTVSLIRNGTGGNSLTPTAPISVTANFAPFYDLGDQPGADQSTPNDQNEGPTAVPRFVSSTRQLILFPGESSPPSSTRWLTLQTGDPGVPGDGKLVSSGNASGSHDPIFFVPQSTVSIGNASDGFTLSIFPSAGVTLQDVSLRLETPSSDGTCPAAVWAFRFYSFVGNLDSISSGGNRGYSVTITQLDLTRMLQQAQQGFGCSYSLANTTLAWFRAGSDTAANITSLDAVAFGLGEYNSPE